MQKRDPAPAYGPDPGQGDRAGAAVPASALELAADGKKHVPKKPQVRFCRTAIAADTCDC